jgi:hypothetical protein
MLPGHSIGHCEHALFLHKSFFNLSFILSAVDGKIKQHVSVKIGKSGTRTFKCFARLLENNFYAGEWFLNGFHLSWLVKCQLKMTSLQGDEASAQNELALLLLCV